MKTAPSRDNLAIKMYEAYVFIRTKENIYVILYKESRKL